MGRVHRWHHVPPELASDLNFVHRRLGISKSALVTSLLQDGLRNFRLLLESLPPEPDDQDMRRFRGASADLILEQMKALQEDVETFKTSGANAVLPKPFNIADLEMLWVEFGVTAC